MIDRLLLFGATGDLAGRFLLPALAELDARAEAPESLQVVGAGRERLSDDEFRRHAAKRLGEHAKEVPAHARERLLGRLRYCRVDVGGKGAAEEVRTLLESTRAEASRDALPPVAAYLALPPGLFAPAVAALGDAGLPGGSRIVVEKPFGTSSPRSRPSSSPSPAPGSSATSSPARRPCARSGGETDAQPSCTGGRRRHWRVPTHHLRVSRISMMSSIGERGRVS